MNLFDQINSHKYLFLDNVNQVSDVELVLLISEGKVDRNTENEITFPNDYSLKFNPINANDFCRKYKITFKNFIIYSVVDESYIERDGNEVFVGGLFRKFSKSRFLDYVSKSLNAEYSEHIYNAKYQHYEIACLNQIIDIACPFEPLIEEITK